MPGLPRLLPAAVLAALFAAAPAGAQTLIIGRVDASSMLYDVCERIVLEAARRAGIALSFRRLPLPRSPAMANAGEIDGDLCRSERVVSDNPNLVAVPTPVTTKTFAVYSQHAALARNTRDDISRMRLVYPRGDYTAEASTRDMNRTEAPNADAALAMLGDRADAAILQYDIVEEILGRPPRRAGITRWKQAWVSSPVYFILNKRHAALVPRLDAALQDMRREGLPDRYMADGRKLMDIPAMPAN